MASRPASALAALVLLLAAAGAQAALRVVASVPDVADMAREIGGERLEISTIAGGAQDPHKVPIKPSFVTRLNRADALVVMGLGLEGAYLPALLEVAHNPHILPGRPAYIDASLHVEALEVPTSTSRAEGELHPLGNPHFNLDPVQGLRMARAIAEGLERVDPAGAEHYRAGLARFQAKLEAKIAEWERLAAPLRGVKAVSYHQDMVYLAHRFGLELVGTIETRPGVPATPAHLEALIARAQEAGVALVIREVAFEPGLARTVATRTGARVAELATLTGGLPGADRYVDFIEANLRALLAALGERGAATSTAEPAGAAPARDPVAAPPAAP